MKKESSLDKQMSITYNYIANIFIAQHPRTPSADECYGDGSVHSYNKDLFINVYNAILATVSKIDN